jgi:hypothetical protein
VQVSAKSGEALHLHPKLRHAGPGKAMAMRCKPPNHNGAGAELISTESMGSPRAKGLGNRLGRSLEGKETDLHERDHATQADRPRLYRCCLRVATDSAMPFARFKLLRMTARCRNAHCGPPQPQPQPPQASQPRRTPAAATSRPPPTSTCVRAMRAVDAAAAGGGRGPAAPAAAAAAAVRALVRRRIAHRWSSITGHRHAGGAGVRRSYGLFDVLFKVGPSGPAHLSSGLLKMTDFSCGLILPKISQQPARQPVRRGQKVVYFGWGGGDGSDGRGGDGDGALAAPPAAILLTWHAASGHANHGRSLSF